MEYFKILILINALKHQSSVQRGDEIVSEFLVVKTTIFASTTVKKKTRDGSALDLNFLQQSFEPL